MKVRAPLESVQQTALRLILAGLIEEVPVFHSTIAITGNVGAGKTSFIRTISEIEVVKTERRATDETASINKDTTVAIFRLT